MVNVSTDNKLRNFDLWSSIDPSRLEELVNPEITNWMESYVQSSKDVKLIHRWNFLEPLTDKQFSIQPLNTVFRRYLDHLHYCRFHSPTPILHIDSQLLWILWNCEFDSKLNESLRLSALNLFCGIQTSTPKLVFFDKDPEKVRISNQTYTLSQNDKSNNLILKNQHYQLVVNFDGTLPSYKLGLRSKESFNLEFVPAKCVKDNEVNILRNLYGLPTIKNTQFDVIKVSKWLKYDWKKLTLPQKMILEIVYFEEWAWISQTLDFPSYGRHEDASPQIQIFDRSINRSYFCWIENNESVSAPPQQSLSINPGVHLHNAAKYITNTECDNVLFSFMHNFKQHGTGQFLDSTILELLNQLNQAGEKWSDETAPYEKTENYFFRIASILWRKSLLGPMTVHLDLTSRCNTKCTFCGYHSPLIKERVWAHSGWQSLDLSPQVFTEFHRQLKLLGGSDEVLLIGGGEPVLHKKATEIIKSLSDSDMNPFLFTNGLVIDEDMSLKLLHSKLFKFYWSIHASDEITWRALHPGASSGQFKRVMDNLGKFIRLRNLHKSATRVIVIHALCKANFKQVNEMIIQSRDLGVDELRFQLMQPVCNELHDQLPDQNELNWIKKTIDKALSNNLSGQTIIETNIQWQLERKEERLKRDSPEIESQVWSQKSKPTTLPVAIDLSKRLNDRRNTVLKNSKGSKIRPRCYAGFFILRSFVDGRLSYCFHDRIVGDLKTKNLSEIWCSDDYQKLRNTALSMNAEQNVNLWDGHKGNWLVAEDCASCSNYEVQNRVEHTLRKTGWWIYLHPETI